MAKLEAEKDKVLSIYHNANTNVKHAFAEVFGEDVFKQEITDRIKTFEDALAVAGASDNMNMLLNYNGIDGDLLAAQAFAKLTIIAKALNEGWEPDWGNSNEYKYYPYFDMGGSSGAGFSYYGCGSDDSNSDVGSRLAFKSSKLAVYAGQQFTDIYRDLLTKK